VNNWLTRCRQLGLLDNPTPSPADAKKQRDQARQGGTNPVGYLTVEQVAAAAQADDS